MNNLPTHVAGDLLVALAVNDTASSINSGWTSLGTATNATWAFDGYAGAYRIADSSSSNAPFTGTQRNVTYWSITGHDATNPIAGSSVSQGGSFGSWTTPRIIGAVGAPSLAGSANAGAAFFPPGFNDYLFGTSNDYTLGTGDFTAECFFKQQVTTGTQTLLDVGSANQLRIVVLSGTEVQASIGNTGVGLTASSAWFVPGWNHVAVTRASGTSRLFINGTFVSSNPNTASISLSGNGIRIGANFNSSNYYQGHISNLRVVKGTAVYPDSSNIAVPTEPLTAVSGTAVLCCNDPGNVNASTGATVAQASSFASPSRDTPFTSQGTNGLRLTLLTGYGGGGNPWNSSGSGHIWGVPGLTRVFNDSYTVYLEGGTGEAFRALFQSGYSGGSLSFVSVGIREAAQSSGFFQFF